MSCNQTDLSDKDTKQIPESGEKAGEELIDKLIGDRLNRIFDGVKAEKSETFEMNGINEKSNDEELIDAGLDLTPDDLQKLPDLSYEE